MMMTSSKCRPRNSAGRFLVTVSPYQIRQLAFATDPNAKELEEDLTPEEQAEQEQLRAILPAATHPAGREPHG